MEISGDKRRYVEISGEDGIFSPPFGQLTSIPFPTLVPFSMLCLRPLTSLSPSSPPLRLLLSSLSPIYLPISLSSLLSFTLLTLFNFIKMSQTCFKAAPSFVHASSREELTAILAMASSCSASDTQEESKMEHKIKT